MTQVSMLFQRAVDKLLTDHTKSIGPDQHDNVSLHTSCLIYCHELLFFCALLLYATLRAKIWHFPATAFVLKVPKLKNAEFATKVDLDEVAHNEQYHLDLHCLPSSL